MHTTVINRGKPKGAKTRYPGIVRIAKNLKVTPNHLRWVLDGKRESEPLIRRLDALSLKPKSPRKSSP